MPAAGVVAAVEVSTDGGATWHTATGTSSWTYPWIVHGAPSTTIRARAVDDSGNIGAPSAARTVSVSCPCSIFRRETPASPDSEDGSSVELGVKFRSDVAGQINGIRFYKAATNTGTHVGSLWTSSGTLLAQATFTGESSSGWQQVNFPSPVAIQPNTTYVAGYFAPNGHYSADGVRDQPTARGRARHPRQPAPARPARQRERQRALPVHPAPAPSRTNTYQSENYWVDVPFTPDRADPAAGPGDERQRHGGSPAGDGQLDRRRRAAARRPATGSPPTSAPPPRRRSRSARPPARKTITGLTGGTTYTFTVTAINEKGSGPESAPSNAVTPTIPNPPGAPTAVSATAGPLQATVNWTAPASDGGSPITSYRITPYIGSIAADADDRVGAGLLGHGHAA